MKRHVPTGSCRIESVLRLAAELESFKMAKKPTVLMILDGYGLAAPCKGNAIALAETAPL
jgi:hypothetical protein